MRPLGATKYVYFVKLIWFYGSTLGYGRTGYMLNNQMGLSITIYAKYYLISYTGLILGLCPVNGKRRNIVATSLISWAQAFNQPWYTS